MPGEVSRFIGVMDDILINDRLELVGFVPRECIVNKTNPFIVVFLCLRALRFWSVGPRSLPLQQREPKREESAESDSSIEGSACDDVMKQDVFGSGGIWLLTQEKILEFHIEICKKRAAISPYFRKNKQIFQYFQYMQTFPFFSA
jgi:hypothetical protein